MTRIVTFADGFTSASAPTVDDLDQETYTLANNTSTLTNLTGLRFSGFTSVFAKAEIERYNASTSYRQTIELFFRKDPVTGAWSIDPGQWIGDDLLQPSTIANIYEVALSVTSAGQVQYKTGNMTSTGYSGKIKLHLIKVAA